MPTLRAVAGAGYPKEHNGRAVTPEEGIILLPAMQGADLPERTLFFSHQQVRAVIRGDWKAVWSKRTTEPLKWELYNLAVGRTGINDLAGNEPQGVGELADAWDEYRARVGLEEFEPWTSRREKTFPTDHRIPAIQGVSRS